MQSKTLENSAETLSQPRGLFFSPANGKVLRINMRFFNFDNVTTYVSLMICLAAAAAAAAAALAA